MDIRWKAKDIMDEKGNVTRTLINGGKPTIQIAYLTGNKAPDGKPERMFLRLGGDPSKGEVTVGTIPDTDTDNCRAVRDQIQGYVQDGIAIAGKWKDILEIVVKPANVPK